MTTKDRLHQLVDRLPETEVGVAERVLEALTKACDPVQWSLEHAPIDDEPLTDEERAAIDEGWAAAARGDVLTDEEMARRLGL